MKKLFALSRAKAYIFRLVRSSTAFTVSDIADRYDISATQVHELCKEHMGKFGTTAIYDMRIELLPSGVYRPYSHRRNGFIFPIGGGGRNPFLKRL